MKLKFNIKIMNKDSYIYYVITSLLKFILVMCVLGIYMVGGLLLAIGVGEFYLWIPLTMWIIYLIVKKIAKVYIKRKLKLT